MAALLRQGARRIGGSVLQRTQAAVTSPAVADERRRLVARRMYSTDEKIGSTVESNLDKKLRERVDSLNRRQLYWELIKMFPARQIFNVVAGTAGLGILVSATIETMQAKKKKQQQQQQQ